MTSTMQARMMLDRLTRRLESSRHPFPQTKESNVLIEEVNRSGLLVGSWV
ncbi:MAG: hypothetical protein OXB98_04020 [Bryobacterales bacterium]|nr:hypothetical protein [Bryobacterales bacterium]